MQTRPSSEPLSPDATESRLLNALASLNRIGSTINRMGSVGAADELAALHQIVESAVEVVPGSSALIYSYDSVAERFVPESRVYEGQMAVGVPGEQPRLDGMGSRAIKQRRLILSYEETDLTIDPRKVRAGARVVACFPLVVAEEPLGVLYVYVGEERHFTSLELLMLENFVNQAAMAISQITRLATVRRDLNRKGEELERLRQAGLIISSRLRLEETLEAILQMALGVTNAEYGIFRLLDKTGSNLVTQAVAGADLSHPNVQALTLDAPSISAWVVHNQQAALIHDLSETPWSEIYYPLDATMEMRSELAVPLISASGRMLGVLNLESPVKNAFSEDDCLMLQSFATQAVIAIQEISLLDALQEIPQVLLTLTEEQALTRLAELASDLLNSPASAIWIKQDGELTLRALSRGKPNGERLYHLLPAVASVLGENEVHFVDSGEFPTGGFETWEWRHAWLAPLTTLVDQAPLGLFCVYTTSDVGLGGADWERKVLEMLAHFAGMAIFYASHQDELRKTQEQRAMAEMFAAVGDLATNLLHQLNNKVGTIPVRVQGIQDKCADLLANDRYLASNLAEIEHSATEAMVAVRENLSHLHPMQSTPVDLAEIVRTAVESASIGGKVQVKSHGLEGLPQVWGGHQNLKLVFTNLIENAAQAMDGKGIVAVDGYEMHDRVEVTVTDSGPGIPAEMHERIFELNYSSGAPSHAGKLGFGLWWVRALMMRLGGGVWVESDGQSGASFRLQFPKAKG